jgi:undecaprenol kinase
MDKPKKVRSVKQGFINAFAGLNWAFKSQINFKIHLLGLLTALLISLILKINYCEWLIVLTVITGVLALELINTSLEQTTDAITDQYHPIIKKAKDTAAAAVLVYALYSVLIGLIIFWPKINRLLSN